MACKRIICILLCALLALSAAALAEAPDWASLFGQQAP